MWLMVMFDLPVRTAQHRKDYARFRNFLIESGFSMLQLSVYARCCPSEDAAARVGQSICRRLPPEGNIRLLTVTDRQFAKMQNFVGKKRKPNERPPRQLELF
ncbi:MAG: CRISPR-associated endonuclease Cas2 [Planctomycetota bacterium]|nr:MAG: CRISPR-associated endonuclease Cas2 [Planctomycetota bacterium]